MANYLAGIVAERMGRPAQLVGAIDAAIPTSDDPAEHAAILILAVLAGATPATAAATVAAIGELVEPGGARPVEFVARLIAALIELDEDDPAVRTAYRSSISATLGDDLSVVIRLASEGGPLEIAFSSSPDGHAPFRERLVSISLTISGRLLFWIARDIADLNRRVA